MEHTKDVYNRFLPVSDEKPPIPPLCRCNSLVSLRLLLTRYSYSRILSKYAGEDAPKALGTSSAAKAPKQAPKTPPPSENPPASSSCYPRKVDVDVAVDVAVAVAVDVDVEEHNKPRRVITEWE
ncbi:hypothetical protein N7447_004784 [Penicillium robsamsonii]|uniref:uncharacterized protein n=1 Tax=Penicillium robsamsonii TaxID=1792511 RepID=UPI002548951B|nr:uncharacterized protein N7447_004784 [Penicillium robsamsonii]KAJ5822444.1 hypothetical protein N7447_004784 [Penicillium robsamsonii]